MSLRRWLSVEVSQHIADVTNKQKVHTLSNQALPSVNNSARVLRNSCMMQQVEVFRHLLYTYADNISTTAKKISNKLCTITKILNFGQIQCPIQDTFSVCIVHFTRVEAKWSLQISSIYSLRQYINSNLGDVIRCSYITTLLSHIQIIRFFIWAYLELVNVWYIGGIRSCSTQTSSIYACGWYINSNLSCVICRKYTTTILIDERVQFPRQKRFFCLYCMIY